MFSGFGGAQVGFDDLGGFFQPEWLWNSLDFECVYNSHIQGFLEYSQQITNPQVPKYAK